MDMPRARNFPSFKCFQVNGRSRGGLGEGNEEANTAANVMGEGIEGKWFVPFLQFVPPPGL